MLIVLLVSLLLTLALEEFFAFLWGLRGRRELGLAAMVNILTNPPVVLFYYTATRLWHCHPLPTTLLLETLAVLVEWRCYRAFSEQLQHPLRFAVGANLFSYFSAYILFS